MKVALVHDYLREYGGAERVLEALHEIFPTSPVFTAYYNPQSLGENNKRFVGWDIRSCWLQYFPFANRLLSPFRIFAAKIFEGFNLQEFDLVISSSAIYFAKAVITKPGSLHISYIHTPPRFLYGYTTSFNYKKNIITRILGEIANYFLRITDFKISQRPDILVANSKNVQARIKKFYRRDAAVVYPPVEINSNYKAETKEKNKYFLVLSRLVRGKGVDIVVEACKKLGLALKIAGTGPELENIKQQISHAKNIEILGWVSDEERLKLLSQAKALIVASEDEDFGITAVEAQAVGTPVIAPKSGGFLETVVDKKTGLLYGQPGMVNADELEKALENFKTIKFNPEDCIKNASKFSKDRFKKEILELVRKHLKGNL